MRIGETGFMNPVLLTSAYTQENGYAHRENGQEHYAGENSQGIGDV